MYTLPSVRNEHRRLKLLVARTAKEAKLAFKRSERVKVKGMRRRYVFLKSVSAPY